jgi:hypothetical protein
MAKQHWKQNYQITKVVTLYQFLFRTVVVRFGKLPGEVLVNVDNASALAKPSPSHNYSNSTIHVIAGRSHLNRKWVWSIVMGVVVKSGCV